MAATAVFASITRILPGSVSTDGKQFSNINATTASFPLLGGKYGVSVIGSTFGTVTLEILGPDGSTYLPVSTATTFSANGFATVDLPSSQFKIVIA